MERTYIMLKPDALQRGLIGEILARIEHKGYRITAMKTMQLDERSFGSTTRILPTSPFSRTPLLT